VVVDERTQIIAAMKEKIIVVVIEETQVVEYWVTAHHTCSY
jgi:hypothetical protein